MPQMPYVVYCSNGEPFTLEIDTEPNDNAETVRRKIVEQFLAESCSTCAHPLTADCT